MAKEIKKEWQKYLLNENKEYTTEELIEDFKEAVDYLFSKHVRLSSDMLVNPQRASEQYHLSEQDQAVYLGKFHHAGYAVNDSEKMVEVMDVLYHVLNISKDEAGEFTLYITENHMTLTDAIEKRYGVSMDDVSQYIEMVLTPYADYAKKMAIKTGKELLSILSEVFSGSEV